jgi:hypothetical protein
VVDRELGLLLHEDGERVDRGPAGLTVGVRRAADAGQGGSDAVAT